jgi:hypothetical protein
MRFLSTIVGVIWVLGLSLTLVESARAQRSTGVSATPVVTPACLGDVVPDGTVGVPDLQMIMSLQGLPRLTVARLARANPAVKFADINLDRIINGADLAIVLGAWGACPAKCQYDLNGDQIVNAIDLSIFLGSYGANQKEVNGSDLAGLLGSYGSCMSAGGKSGRPSRNISQSPLTRVR